jgi:c-di-GMP-binding flagellar brake protein YcgR
MKDELIEELKEIINRLRQLADQLLQEDSEPKRTYDRLRYRIPLEYSIYQTSLESDKIPAGYGRVDKSIAKDISAGGILFEVTKPLPIGAILKMKLDLSFINRTIECLVRIVRLDEIKDIGKYTGKYNVGVCFLDISSDDKVVLDKFIQEERETVKKKMP